LKKTGKTIHALKQLSSASLIHSRGWQRAVFQEVSMASSKKLVRSAVLLAGLALTSLTFLHADTIYNTTGGAENGGDPLSPTFGAGPVLADRFVSPFDAYLTSVTLNLELYAVTDPSFTVNLYSDEGASGPGASLLQIASVSDSSLTFNFQLYTYNVADPFLLTAGSSYYIGVTDDGSNAVLGNTVDPTILAQPDVIAGADYYNNGGVQANSGGPYEIEVDASPATSPVPEPSSIVLLLTGGVAAAGAARRRLLVTKA
jgi:hypothetical protein